MSKVIIPETSLPIRNFPVPAGQGGPRAGEKTEDRDLKKACADFEALFVYRMLEVMRKTVPEGGLFSGRGGIGNGTYQMLFDQKLAEALTSRGRGIGLQQVLYEQLKKTAAEE